MRFLRHGLQNSALARRRLGVVLLCLACQAGAWAAAAAEPLYAATLTGLDDKPTTLANLRGKPLIVNFWARWCGPCRVEIPELAKLQGRYQDKGLVVLGIGIEDQVEAARDFAKAYEMNYRVVLAKDKGIELMRALGNAKAGLPFTVVVDRKGEILTRKLGVMSAADLEAAAETVLRQP